MKKLTLGASVGLSCLWAAPVLAQSTNSVVVFQLNEIAADEGVMCGSQRFVLPDQPDQGAHCTSADNTTPHTLLHMNQIDRMAIGRGGSVWILRGNLILRDTANQAFQVDTLPEAGKALGFELFGNPTTLTLGGTQVTEWDGMIVLMASGKAYYRLLTDTIGWRPLTVVNPDTGANEELVALSALTDPVNHAFRVPELVAKNANIYDFAFGPGKIGTIDKLPSQATTYAGNSSFAIGFRCFMHTYQTNTGSTFDALRKLTLNDDFDLVWGDITDYSVPPIPVSPTENYWSPFDVFTQHSIDDDTGAMIFEKFAGELVCDPSGFDHWGEWQGKVEAFVTGSKGRAYAVVSQPPFQTLSLDIGTWKDPYAKLEFWNDTALTPAPGAPVLLEVDERGGPVYSVSSGYHEIPSSVRPTYKLPVPRELVALDVFVPSASGWAGGIQLSADVGPGVLSNAYIGYVGLDSVPKGEWTTVTVELPTAVYDALAGEHPVSQIHTFVNAGPNGVKVRGLRFEGEAPTIARSQPDLLNAFVRSNALTGFEETGSWSGTTAEPTQLRFTDGSHSVRLNTGGYAELVSRTFSTAELSSVSDKLSLDVFVPSPAPNPYWMGDVQMFLSCPTAGIYSHYLGRADLAQTYPNQWNSITLPLDVVAQSALESTNTCQFTIAINTPPTALPTAFFVDRLGFIAD